MQGLTHVSMLLRTSFEGRTVGPALSRIVAPARTLFLAGLAALLVGCGGGESGSTDTAKASESRERALGASSGPNTMGAIGTFAIDHTSTTGLEASNTPISLAFLNDHVAGSKGYLKNVGGKLYAGTDRIRLYGTAFINGAIMPAKAEATKVAARLRKEGFNAIRLMNWDAPLANNGVWSVTYLPQGLLNADQTLNAVALDYFDYFVHQLQQQGIYVLLPLHSGRTYLEAPDCIEYCEGLHQFMPVLVDSYKRLAASLLNHVNPYSGRAYKSDPGIFAFELGNEDSVVHRWANGTIDAYVNTPSLYTLYGSVLESRWRTWLTTRYGTPAAVGSAWGQAISAFSDITVPLVGTAASMPAAKYRDWIEFASGLDTAFSSDIYNWLKGTVGVKNLVLGGQGHYQMTHSREASDLADYHSYFGDKGVATGQVNPITGDPVFQVQNRSVLSFAEPKDFGLFGVSEYKDPTKPNLLTEYAARMGSQYVAEAEPLVSAYAGFQDMDAIFLFDAHQMNQYGTNKYYTGWYNVSVSAVSRVVAALSFRRGDTGVGAPAVLKKTKNSILNTAAASRNWNPVNFHFGGNARTPITTNMYQQVVATEAEEQIAVGPGAVNGVYTTTSGQLTWKPLDRITVDTPMTKTAIGYFSESDVNLGSGVQVHVGTTMNNYAVIQLTSLNAGAVLPSTSMLLALTGYFTVPGEFPRVPGQNTYSWGNDLPRIESVPATVRITTQLSLAVWALDPSGARRTQVPVVRDGPVVQFSVGPDFNTGWYLIEQDGPPVNLSPTISISAPSNAVVGIPVALSAIASDRDGTVASVEYFDGATPIGTATAPPYTVNWTPSTPGTHTLTARATDNQGATGTSSAVAVLVATPNNTPPTVTLSAPTAGTVGVAATLTASASDIDGTVTQVEFLDGDTVIATLSSAPFSFQWTPQTQGPHYLSARATDNGAAVSTSAIVTMTVSPPPNRPPLVALTAPASASVGSAFALSATASDPDGLVTQVEFVDGTTVIGSFTAAPYNVNWTPTTSGVHYLTARATDNTGAVTTSAITFVDVAPATLAGQGLLASYFPNRTLSGAPAIVRVEAVNGTWSSSSTPGYGIPVDNWSARWSGRIQWPTSGTYTLQVIADDGTRVWVDGQLLANRWADGGNFTFNIGPFDVAGGASKSLVIEHFEGSGNASIVLRWKTPQSGIYYSVVPATALLPAAVNAQPSVSLSAPASGLINNAMALSAAAADSDGSIAKVEFFDGLTLIGTLTAPPYALNWTPQTEGEHRLTAWATDNAGLTVISPAVLVSVTAPPTTGGLQAQYFANTTLTGPPALLQIETVNFSWVDPAGPIPNRPDNWSARWSGRILWPTTGNYTLQVIADDGIRVWVDGQQLVNKWSSGGNVTYTLPAMAVSAATASTIVIEHYDGTGNSTVKLRWKTPSSGIYYGTVPGSALSPQ